ncbi:hypothetical protein GSI_02665 [Ganoderma sinense ZZ0214-1]|uniref:Uncharacterized protein n=1 Tax=Ganoderma sinense ZZ0214-1 TaxID=1077348 RepID=A0A2G8SMS6_9APHY|nr:hypothetical protein GSI_02665 [Ganoderma sinense ZZ0214-1]
MLPPLTTTEQSGDHEDHGYDHPEEVDSPDTLQTLPASGSSVRGEDTPGISTLQDILLSMGTVDLMFVNGRLVININLGVANNKNASNRAATLIKCMEVIPDELVLRYNKLRSSDSEGMEECPVCHDALVSVPKAPGDEDTVDASPHPIVAFPFNIDPDRKLRQYLFGSWQPPQVESMCDWLAAKEQAKEAEFAECDLAMSECPAPSPATPPSLGSEVDTNTSLDRDASPLVGDSETNGTSPSGSAPRTSESYLTVRVADDDIGIGL